jgi:hypothetical protein
MKDTTRTAVAMAAVALPFLSSSVNESHKQAYSLRQASSNDWRRATSFELFSAGIISWAPLGAIITARNTRIHRPLGGNYVGIAKPQVAVPM